MEAPAVRYTTTNDGVSIEILIPEPLRHLLSGKSYVYSDRSEMALKGFDDAVRPYEVRWRE